MTYDIFISYRREDGKGIARILKESLKYRNYSVFLDFDNLTDGVFDKRIMEAIDSAPIFVVILSEHSLDRCINDKDWVRREIEYAVLKNKHIIPINPDKKFKRFPEGLPTELVDNIGQHQFSVLDTDQLYNESLEKIIRERIDPIISKEDSHNDNITQSINDEQQYHSIEITSDTTCELLIDKKRICKIKKGKSKIVKIPSNDIVKLTFNCLEYKIPPIIIDYKKENDDGRIINLSFSKRKEEIENEKRKKIEEERKARKSFKSMISNYEKVDTETFDGLTLVQNYGLFGFLDYQGLEVIPCIYEKATRFSQGFASVWINGKWHIIDKYGLEPIDVYSETPIFFIDSLSVICQEGKYGIIDINGKTIIECTYDYLTYPSVEHLLFAKKNDKFYVINVNNEIVNPIPYESYSTPQQRFTFEKENDAYRYRTIDASKDMIKEDARSIIIDIEGQSLDIPTFPCFVSQRGLFGRLNKDGKQIIPCFAESFGDTYHCIVQAHSKYGIMNLDTGKMLIPITYSILFPYYSYYQDPILYFAANSGYFSPDIFYRLDYFGRGYPYHKMFVSDSYGLIDENNHTILPFEYNAIHVDFGDIVLGLKLPDEYKKDVNLLARFFMEGREGIAYYIQIACLQDFCYTIDTYIDGKIQKSTTYSGHNISEEIDYDNAGFCEPHSFNVTDEAHYTDKFSEMSSEYEGWRFHDSSCWLRIDRDTERELKEVEKTYDLSDSIRERCKFAYGNEWEKVFNAIDATSYELIYKNNHYGLYNKKYNKLLLPIKYKSISISIDTYRWGIKKILLDRKDFVLPNNLLLDIMTKVKRDKCTCEFGIRLNTKKETYYSFDMRFTPEKNLDLLT